MTQPMTIIGLTGPAGSGKDTVANLLQTHAGFERMAFADQLRQEVAEAFDEEQILFTRRETKEHPLSALALRRCRSRAFVDRLQVLSRGAELDLARPRTPRQIMQWWGTEYRRADDPNYWLNALLQRIERAMLCSDGLLRIVVSDVRFANEALMLRAPDLGGLIWRVCRPGCATPAGAHSSETDGALIAPDAKVDNSGDIRHLQQQVLGLWWAHDAGLERVTVEIPA